MTDVPRIGQVIDGYMLEEIIAVGSTTITFRGRHELLDRPASLRVFTAQTFAASPGAREAARRDARQIAALEHPAIAAVFAAGDVGEAFYVASALVSGGRSLSDAVASATVTPARCAVIVTALADALAYAHASGVVHREVRPDAIAIDRWGHPVLVDFGVTRTSGRTQMATGVELVDTVRYLAPELVVNEPSTPAADAFGLAATALFCLTGEHPFPDLPAARLIALRATGRVPRIADCPAQLHDVLAAGLAARPDTRCDVSTFARGLSGAIASLGPAADRPSPLRLAGDGDGETLAFGDEGTAASDPSAAGDVTRIDRQRTPKAPAPEPDRRRRWRLRRRSG